MDKASSLISVFHKAKNTAERMQPTSACDALILPTSFHGKPAECRFEMRLLLVEDNLELADGLVHSLGQSNHIVDAVHTGSEALTSCATTAYQLVVLDLGLPDMDGMEVLRRIRERGITFPILILTARDDLQGRIRGLDAGADDYLLKPFELGELEARIRALLRRGSGSHQSFGKINFDQVSRQVSVDGRQLDLTAREVAVLELLLQRLGRIVSKQQLLDSIYTDAHETNPAVVEVFVSRLRRKLEEANAGVGIRVLRGLGYRLELSPNEFPSSS
jgi:DNA-binding response OmpR family regulator